MNSNIKNWLVQIKKGYLDLCILSLIDVEKKAYGFQLITLLEKLEIPVKEGTLYPLLNRMTKEGLLASTWETENLQGHPRKFYSLTKLGKKSLLDMQDEFESMNQIYKKIRTLEEVKNGKSTVRKLSR